ncbi:MAG TPA: hypothetical protein VEI57_07210 [Nitrospirota bacterium]|nr:hypothetical protein [Nitrospirota bacterium]
MNKLFFSHPILDTLVAEGRIKLEKNILTLLEGEQPSFELEPAYRFVKTADNSSDPNNLVGRIKYEKEIKEMHAELYMHSVLYRDTAYEVEPGFIGEKKELLERLSDTDLLTRFLLENLF